MTIPKILFYPLRDVWEVSWMDEDQPKTKLFANTILVKAEIIQFIEKGMIEDMIEIDDAG